MNINGFEWPEEPLTVVSGVVRPYVPDAGPAIIVDPQHSPIIRAVPAPQPARSRRGLPGELRTTNIHSEPSIVNRLIRMVEELTEREDIPDADMRWYANRLAEIKKELADAKERGSETGLGDRPVTASETPRAAVQGNGGSLSGD